MNFFFMYNLTLWKQTLSVFTTQIDPLQLHPIFNKAGLHLLTRLEEYRFYSINNTDCLTHSASGSEVEFSCSSHAAAIVERQLW